jgi:mannosyl-oligosaccharide alpha-1,2-mannosidase
VYGRPEAIESVWYMYRITGDRKWQDEGWKMFKAIVRHTTTEVGSSAIDNVLTTKTTQLNEMESFWTAETLKYFYLL